ncbi:DUF2933 domain-containing protein [Tranquillimonas alkanivorans]|nr:DUF2933 domain-containing protein [Tranquillimonas alkanivorans]
MKLGMMACCAIMLLPVAGFFASGGTLAGLWSNAAVFAPLVLCLGMHLVMHRMMGRSCHGKQESEEADGAETAPIPVPVEAAKPAPR